MSDCNIVVVGGSAGALDPLRTLLGSLPADFDGAVFVVIHRAPDPHSTLSKILDRAGPLRAAPAGDREPIRHGHVYVAPPDRHLTLEKGMVRVQPGPRENRHRPAIDPLFRTAARVYGDRVIAVLVSGFMDDGAAGLLAVRASGGFAIVQDPEEATARQMPDSALKYAGADRVLAAAEIGPEIVTYFSRRARGGMTKPKAKKSKRESVFANLHAATPDESVGKPSTFSCPECGGVLWELKDDKLVRFRCRVGHAYTINNLGEEQDRAVEASLWAAMRALEEKAALEKRLSESMTDPKMGSRFKERAQTDSEHAETIRKVLFGKEKGKSEDEPFEKKRLAS